MSRMKMRTEFLMPVYKMRLLSWIPNMRKAKNIIGLIDFADQDFWRILRGDEATPEEIATVKQAILQYGKEHRLAGWEDLK